MWFWLALVATIISSFSIIINKRILRGVNPSVLLWTTLVISTPIIAVYALRQDIPITKMLFWVGVVGSVGFYAISRILRFRSFKTSDLSDVYPLVAFDPIIVLLIATLPPLKESPSFLAVVGMITVILGVYILNIRKQEKGLLQPLKRFIHHKGSLLMLGSIVLGATVIIFDKVAIKSTMPESSAFVLLIENLLVVALFLPFLVIKHRDFIVQIRKHLKYFLILGILNACSTIIYFSSISKGDVALVAAIINSKILFVLILSVIFFKEKITKFKIFGVIVLTAGAVLLKVYG